MRMSVILKQFQLLQYYWAACGSACLFNRMKGLSSRIWWAQQKLLSDFKWVIQADLTCVNHFVSFALP